MAALTMAGDATTLPLPGSAPASVRRRLLGAGSGARADASSATRLGAGALVTIVVLALFVVLMAANRPSVLTPTTHTGYFPHWMAGPLGGLMPWFTSSGNATKYLFSGAIVAMFVAYAIVVRDGSRLPVRWVAAAIVVAHLVLFLSPPLALTDLFNYINYGRMEVVHNLNPYTSIPILEPHNDPAYILSNWHELLSPYGPLFTLITFAVVPLGVAASFWVLKALLMLASLGIVWLVWKCARLLGRDPVAAIALAGLNPVVLVWGLGGDHNDFLMMFCIVLGFYLLLAAGAREGAAGPREGVPLLPARDVWREAPARVRAAVVAVRAALPGWRGWLVPLSALEVGAGVAFVAAVALKASGAVLVPVVLAWLAHRPRALVQTVLGMLIASVVMGAASLLAFGLHIPDLSTQGSLVTSESIPNLIGLAIGLGGESTGLRHVMSAVLVATIVWCCWLAWRRRDAVTASGWASIALLVTLSWVLPWYVLWVLPLAALSASRRLRVATLVFGVYLIVAWAPASGNLWDLLHFYPQKTSLGRLHQRYVKELLD